MSWITTPKTQTTPNTNISTINNGDLKQSGYRYIIGDKVSYFLFHNVAPLKSRLFSIWEYEEYENGLSNLVFLPNSILEVIHINNGGNFLINDNINCLIKDRLFARSVYTASTTYYNRLFNAAVNAELPPSSQQNKELFELRDFFDKYINSLRLSDFDVSERSFYSAILKHLSVNDIDMSEVPLIDYEQLDLSVQNASQEQN